MAENRRSKEGNVNENPRKDIVKWLESGKKKKNSRLIVCVNHCSENFLYEFHTHNFIEWNYHHRSQEWNWPVNTWQNIEV